MELIVAREMDLRIGEAELQGQVDVLLGGWRVRLPSGDDLRPFG